MGLHTFKSAANVRWYPHWFDQDGNSHPGTAPPSEERIHVKSHASAGAARVPTARKNTDPQQHVASASIQQRLTPVLELDKDLKDLREKQKEYQRKGAEKRKKIKQAINPQQRKLPSSNPSTAVTSASAAASKSIPRQPTNPVSSKSDLRWLSQEKKQPRLSVTPKKDKKDRPAFGGLEPPRYPPNPKNTGTFGCHDINAPTLTPNERYANPCYIQDYQTYDHYDLLLGRASKLHGRDADDRQNLGDVAGWETRKAVPWKPYVPDGDIQYPPTKPATKKKDAVTQTKTKTKK
jgi:hypothetical protein